jgi:GT2 family glycosyltransferase
VSAAPRLSVVIVNYNTWADLRACLAALEKCAPRPQVIVVDNDGSASAIPRVYPWAEYLPQPENRWFCGGNNVGIAAARGEYVLLLNPDTIPQAGALDALVAFMDAHPEYTGATIQLRYPDGAIQRTCSQIPTYSYLLLNHTPLGWLLRSARMRANMRQWYHGWDRASDRDVAVLPGSCLLMRRAGLCLDDALLLYFPEDDLARRFAGSKFRFLAGPHIIHREKAATRSWLATQVYFRDLIVYTRKHHGAAQAALLWALSRPLLWGMALRRRLNPDR